MQKLSKKGLELIKAKYALKSNKAVAHHIGVNFVTLWRALNRSAGGEFVAKTLRACPGLSYHDIFFDHDVTIAQHTAKPKRVANQKKGA